MESLPQEIPKVVGITGHRSLAKGDIPKIRAALKALVGNPAVSEIWFGGALGADTVALQAALEFRVGRRPKLVVVVPNTTDHQPVETRAWIHRADQVIELKAEITVKNKYQAFQQRNEFIVDHSSVLVAFWNGLFKSGTGSCVRYAQTTKCKLKHIPCGPAA